MARGGARNRSGPQADPSSARSDRRGFTLTELPSSGFDGKPPVFPLPKREIFKKVESDGATTWEFDAARTKAVAEREGELWAWAWSLPQACAWSTQSWRWMNVADLVRLQVRGEAHDAPVNIATVVRQLRADLGLTPAGLKENGWAIAADEVGARREADAAAPPARRSSRDKLTVVKASADGA